MSDRRVFSPAPAGGACGPAFEKAPPAPHGTPRHSPLIRSIIIIKNGAKSKPFPGRIRGSIGAQNVLVRDPSSAVVGLNFQVVRVHLPAENASTGFLARVFYRRRRPQAEYGRRGAIVGRGGPRAGGSSVRAGGCRFPWLRETHANPRGPDRPPFLVRPRPKMPMSQDARPELLDALRYVMIDVLESNRGRWVAAIIFFAAWGSLVLLFLLWGAVLGWIPAAALAIYLGYVCR